MTTKLTTSSIRLAVAGLLAAAAATSAFAQAQGLLDNSFVINGGVFVQSSDIKGSLNGQSAKNPEINFNDSFGKASNASRARLDALWRINPNHHFRFLYFDNDNTRSKVIDKDASWGDYTFHAGTNVDLKTKYEVYELAYEYAFMRAPSYEISGSLGVHYTHLTIRLTGNATLTQPDGTTTAVNGAVKQSSVPAPLPVIGLRGGWVVAPQFYIDAEAQLFKVNINGIDGNWSDLRLGGTWMFHKNFGVGLGYNRFYTHASVDKPDFNGNLKFGYQGLQAYLSGTF